MTLLRTVQHGFGDMSYNIRYSVNLISLMTKASPYYVVSDVTSVVSFGTIYSIIRRFVFVITTDIRSPYVLQTLSWHRCHVEATSATSKTDRNFQNKNKDSWHDLTWPNSLVFILKIQCKTMSGKYRSYSRFCRETMTFWVGNSTWRATRLPGDVYEMTDKAKGQDTCVRLNCNWSIWYLWKQIF